MWKRTSRAIYIGHIAAVVGHQSIHLAYLNSVWGACHACCCDGLGCT